MFAIQNQRKALGAMIAHPAIRMPKMNKPDITQTVRQNSLGFSVRVTHLCERPIRVPVRVMRARRNLVTPARYAINNSRPAKAAMHSPDKTAIMLLSIPSSGESRGPADDGQISRPAGGTASVRAGRFVVFELGARGDRMMSGSER
jgi:hypothetical protein